MNKMLYSHNRIPYRSGKWASSNFIYGLGKSYKYKYEGKHIGQFLESPKPGQI